MRWIVVLLLSGCSSILGIDDFQLGDAGSTGDAPETGFCLGPSGAFRVCVATEPTEPFSSPSAFNFSTSITGGAVFCRPPPKNWMDAGQPDACFILASEVTVSAAVQVTGDRPLVIFAADSITIDAPFDVASHLPQAKSGPGVTNQARCVAPSVAGNAPAGGGAAAGAAGGSFMGKGGDGGTTAVAGVNKGIAAAADSAQPMLLRAGCDGGDGGDTGIEQGGTRGRGGGAIYLVAGNRITINSVVNASGSAGGGAGRSAGGGGGGSGGMIVLHAPAIVGNSGVLIANGGGGGGGGGPQLGGGAGAEPVPTMPGVVAQGGTSGSNTGVGGNGSAGIRDATVGLNGNSNGAGGGGGGGGAGSIRTNVAPTQVTTSPEISPP